MIRISRKGFDRMVEEAIALLPEEYAQWLEEVPVIVEDRPGRADVEQVDGGEETLGMYAGRELGHEQEDFTLPPRVMIYREPLMEACSTREELADEIRKTLFHELGHYAGMDEEELERRGYGGMESEEEDIEWDVDEEEDEK